jgi:hypothetical protein
MNINIGNKNYNPHELKKILIDLTAKIDHNDENEIYDLNIIGGRKICLGSNDSEKFQYNEILDAVLQATQKEFNALQTPHKMKPSPGSLALPEYSDIESILNSLKKLKDVGHEKGDTPSVGQRLYNIFRRCFPNRNRDKNLNELQEILKKSQESLDSALEIDNKRAQVNLEPEKKAQALAIEFAKNQNEETSLKQLQKLLDENPGKENDLLDKWVYFINDELRNCTNSLSKEDHILYATLLLNGVQKILSNLKQGSCEEYVKTLSKSEYLTLSQTALVCNSLGKSASSDIKMLIECDQGQFSYEDKALFQEGARARLETKLQALVDHLIKGNVLDHHWAEILIKSSNIPKKILLLMLRELEVTAVRVHAEFLERDDNPEKITEKCYPRQKPNGLGFTVSQLVTVLYPIYEQISEEDKGVYFGEDFKMQTNQEGSIQISVNQGKTWQVHS